jgi:hypothetical protein
MQKKNIPGAGASLMFFPEAFRLAKQIFELPGGIFCRFRSVQFSCGGRAAADVLIRWW